MSKSYAGKGSTRSENRSVKEQISLEYMMLFAFAFLIVAVVVAYLYVTGVHNTTYTDSYCYLTPDMPCQGMYVIGNSVSPTNAKAYVIFTNEKNIGAEYVRFLRRASFGITCLLDPSASIIEALSNLTFPSFNEKPSTLGCTTFCLSTTRCKPWLTNLLKLSSWCCIRGIVSK